MESFDVGSHVMVELENDRRLWGYLISVGDDGMIFKVTHREMEVLRKVSDASSLSIAAELTSMPLVKLRLIAAFQGQWRLLGLSRARLVEAVQVEMEKRMVEDRDDGMQLRELSVPVLTFVAYGVLRTMEASEDRMVEAELGDLDSELAGLTDD